jgi:hypothetical protein
LNILIKHIRRGPVTFVRNGERVGFAWGYPKEDAQRIPTVDAASDGRGVTWHPTFFDALVAWAAHREIKHSGGVRDGRESPLLGRPVKEHRDLHGA